MSAAVAIFAKAPVPGRVKTRLVPPLTPLEAARVARLCLEETLRRFPASAPAEFTLFLDGRADPALSALCDSLGVPLRAQSEGDLGKRLRDAFRALRDRGAARTLAIGSDSPTLDPARIREAIDALETSDVVIGPAEDGGYYLIGVRESSEAIFEEIPWSTRSVARITLERARRAGLRAHVLPPFYDLDDLASVRRAAREWGRPDGALARLLQGVAEREAGSSGEPGRGA